jgi:hypothetical protein
MTTPQDPGKRNRQKARRRKQLAEWREKKAAAESTHAATDGVGAKSEHAEAGR